MANPINPLQVVLERLGCSDPAKGAFFPWDEVRDWPAGTLESLVASGLLKPAQPTNLIDCDGCEENCTMPVTVYPAQEGKPGKAFITCDKRDDIGRVPVDFRRMEQWQATGGLVADLLAELLKISQPRTPSVEAGQWQIGTIKGKKYNGEMSLVDGGNRLSLALGGHTIPLVDVLSFEKNALALDKAALIPMVDNPASKGDSETPGQRKARLIARVKQERAKGTRGFLKVVADEEGIHVSRLKQIINKKHAPNSSISPENKWEAMLGQKTPTSSKKSKTRY